MKDSHSPQKLSKTFLIPANRRGFSISNSGPGISPSRQSDIFNRQAVSKDFSSLVIKDFGIPNIGQGFTFPDSNQRFHYLQLSGIYFPQQDDYSTYMHNHYNHIS